MALIEPYEVLLRIVGGVARGHVRQLRTDDDGVVTELDAVPIAAAGPEFAAFLPAFNNATAAERDALADQVAQLAAERDALADQVAQLTAERDALAAALGPVGPRILYPYEFLGRFTVDERLAILAAADDDKRVGLVLMSLQTVQRVDLDAAETVAGVEYLAALGLIAADRIPQILG